MLDDLAHHMGWTTRPRCGRFRLARDPVSLAMAATVGGAAVSAGGKLMSGYAQAQEGKVAEKNAVTLSAEQQQAAQHRAFVDAAKTRDVAGRLEANAGSSGAPTGMTIADIAGDIAAKGAYDVSAANAEGTQQAKATRYAGYLAKKRGDNAFAGSILDAGATALTAAGKLGPRVGTGSGSTGADYDPSWSNTWPSFG